MLFLVLGKGKTGSLVAEVARERGHGVRALDHSTKMSSAAALTAPNLAGVDVVIDFTAPEAAVENMRAVLSLGGRIVVGTTGWYAQLAELKALAQQARRRSALRNQLLDRRAEALPADGGAGAARRLQVCDRRDAPHVEARRAFGHGTHAARDHSSRPTRNRGRGDVAPRRRRQGRACCERRRATTTCWSCGMMRTRGAALRWAPCGARSGWRANRAAGISGKSSTSCKS